MLPGLERGVQVTGQPPCVHTHTAHGAAGIPERDDWYRRAHCRDALPLSLPLATHLRPLFPTLDSHFSSAPLRPHPHLCAPPPPRNHHNRRAPHERHAHHPTAMQGRRARGERRRAHRRHALPLSHTSRNPRSQPSTHNRAPLHPPAPPCHCSLGVARER